MTITDHRAPGSTAVGSDVETTHRFQDVDGWERIASFDTAERAAMGVAHLLELHYDAGHVAITPARVESAPDPRKRSMLVRSARAGAVFAGGATAAIALIDAGGLTAFLFTVVPMIVAAAVLGGVVAATVSMARYRRALSWTGGAGREHLRVSVFDVKVGRDPHRARQDLARWWDPGAPTVACDRIAAPSPDRAGGFPCGDRAHVSDLL